MQRQGENSAPQRSSVPFLALATLLAFIVGCLAVCYFVFVEPIKLVKDATHAWEGGSLQFCAQATTTVGRIVRFDLDVNNDGVFDYTNTDVTKGTGLGLDLPLMRLLGDRVDNGSYPATLRVYNSWGIHRDFPTEITVGNAPINIEFDPDAVSGMPGEPFSIQIWTNDPGPDTVYRIQVDWGDESSTVIDGSSATPTHIYANEGDYTIRATVTDEDETRWAEHSIHIGPDRPPARFVSFDPVILSGHATILESRNAVLTVDARDFAGCPAVLEYRWGSNLEGVISTIGSNEFEIAPTDAPYPYTAWVHVVDDNGHMTEALFAFKKGGNVPPLVSDWIGVQEKLDTEK